MRIDLKGLKLIVLDVDGTMTDGGIYYDSNGNELKKFCTRDAAGIDKARKAGIDLMVLTGRKCIATERRMKELGITMLYQNIKDKSRFLSEYMREKGYSSNDAGYIGDDVNDVDAMKLCGFIGCPSDSCREVKKLADYISTVNGGYGAVRDVIEYIMHNRNEL